MVRTCALIAMLIAGALIDLARGGDLLECEPQRVTGDSRHWAYRIVDGRECWYPGQPGKSKSELFWGNSTTPSTRQTVDQTEVETKSPGQIEAKIDLPEEPQTSLAAIPPEEPKTIEPMPDEWRAAAADQLLAFTCCWPELEKP